MLAPHPPEFDYEQSSWPVILGPRSRRWPRRICDLFEWIDAWCNPKGRHTSLGVLPPIDYERHQKMQPALHAAVEGAA